MRWTRLWILKLGEGRGLHPEVLARESLTELPVGRDYVPRGGCASVAPRDPKGQ